MKRAVQVLIFVLCVGFTIAAIVNVFADNSEVELMAKGVACEGIKAKPGTKEFRVALRDALESTKELVATHGVYTMSPTEHNGLDNRARTMIKIENGKWVLAK